MGGGRRSKEQPLLLLLNYVEILWALSPVNIQRRFLGKGGSGGAGGITSVTSGAGFQSHCL